MVVTAFILGLLGSFHCLGMCGPIAFLLPVDRKSRTKRILQIAIYHLGRLTTYTMLGSIFGLLGKSVRLFGLQQQVSIVIGILMILVILLPKSIHKTSFLTKKTYKFVGIVKEIIGLNLKKKSLDLFFSIGFFNGLLPCGLLYMAIFGAIASGTVLQGSLYMIFFGLGTMPLMTAAIYISNMISIATRKKFLSLVPVFVCLIGVLFILRGMGLGIKYISPSEHVSLPKISAKHSCH